MINILSNTHFFVVKILKQHVINFRHKLPNLNWASIFLSVCNIFVLLHNIIIQIMVLFRTIHNDNLITINSSLFTNNIFFIHCSVLCHISYDAKMPDHLLIQNLTYAVPWLGFIVFLGN